MASSKYAENGEILNIEAVTLNHVVNKIKDKGNLLLQMDCEGSEFDIIPNSDLSVFDEISVEYHQKFTNKDYHLLIDEIKKQDFNIENIYKAPSLQDTSIKDIGIIHVRGLAKTIVL